MFEPWFGQTPVCAYVRARPRARDVRDRELFDAKAVSVWGFCSFVFIKNVDSLSIITTTTHKRTHTHTYLVSPKLYFIRWCMERIVTST